MVHGSLPRGEEGKLARGGCCNLQHLFVHHTTSLPLGCCVARGLHPLTLPGEGRQMLQPGMGKCAGPRDGCKEDAHKGVFRELMGAGCRWGGHGNCVCSHSPRRLTTTTSHPVTIYGPNSTHPSTQCPDEPWWVTCYSSTSLWRSLLALLSMDAMCVSALVDLHKPLVLFQALSLLRHLPQECTLQEYPLLLKVPYIYLHSSSRVGCLW